MSDRRFIIDFVDHIQDEYPEMSEENQYALADWMFWKFECDSIWDEIDAWMKEGGKRLGIPESEMVQ